jgi:tRNA(Ile)-lysidine synthase
MRDNLIERVLKTIRSYEMLKGGETVLVAVSGGPDSVFLLQALSHLK